MQQSERIADLARQSAGRISRLRRFLHPSYLGPAVVGAIIVGAIFLAVLPSRVGPAAEEPIRVGPPILLLGNRGVDAPNLPIASLAEKRFFLFMRLAERPIPAQLYELILRGSSGVTMRQAFPGNSFDATGALGALVSTDAFHDGERVEAQVLRTGDPSPILKDAFVVHHPQPGP